MYVIQNTDTDALLGVDPGHRGYTYTHDVRKAKIFSTSEQARNYGICTNERVVSVQELLHTEYAS